MNDDFESLDALLGVTIEPSPRPERVAKPRTKSNEDGLRTGIRHTEWNNFASFAFTGYVARVTRFYCTCCERTSDTLEGIFVEETHLPSHIRRMTQLAPKGDWPAQGSHRKEVTQQDVAYCALCVGDLGFDREVDGHGEPWALLIRGD